MIEEKYLSIRQLIEAMTPEEGKVVDDWGASAMTVEGLEIDMPVEMDLQVTEEGEYGIEMGMAPPLYYADTSILPVFHQVRMTVKVNYKE